jgi:hypothetical protein
MQLLRLQDFHLTVKGRISKEAAPVVLAAGLVFARLTIGICL